MPKPRYTVEEVVKALEDQRGLMFLAARQLGCHVNTLKSYKNKHKAVAEACEQKRGEMVDTAESKLWDALEKGEAWSICFVLKTLGKSRGYVERQEITGADAKPIQVVRGVDEGAILGASTSTADPSQS